MKILNNSEGQGSLPFQNAHTILDYFTTKISLYEELKMNQEDGTIYIITNLVNGKQYVGQTIRKLKQRIREHEGVRRDCPIFHNAIKKYGIENFKVISFSCPEEDLDWMETFLIAELNTRKPNGYNLESGGHKNKHHHESSRQKMRENNLGENNHFYGKNHTEITKQKMRKNHADISGEKNPWFNNHTFIGENNPNAKLTKKDVIEIRKLIDENKLTRKEIFNHFNISKKQFYRIKNYESWKK